MGNLAAVGEGLWFEHEIIGTQGILRIASVPQKNMVEILDSHGVRKECSQDFLERFGDGSPARYQDDGPAGGRPRPRWLSSSTINGSSGMASRRPTPMIWGATRGLTRTSRAMGP